MINVTIWSDFACPYCYIGETRLNKAIEELGLTNDVQIDFRAFELNPSSSTEVTASTPERFARKYFLSLEAATQKVEQISQLGRELGIDFRYATTKYSNTHDAHRLMKLAEHKYDRPTVAKLNASLFDAYYTKNLVLSDHRVLLEKAVEAGLNEDDVKEVLNTNLYDDEVRFDEHEASMRRVHGVPYMVVNGETVLPGALPIESFKSVLQGEIDKQSRTIQKIPSDHHECGPDGCKL